MSYTKDRFLMNYKYIQGLHWILWESFFIWSVSSQFRMLECCDSVFLLRHVFINIPFESLTSSYCTCISNKRHVEKSFWTFLSQRSLYKLLSIILYNNIKSLNALGMCLLSKEMGGLTLWWYRGWAKLIFRRQLFSEPFRHTKTDQSLPSVFKERKFQR